MVALPFMVLLAVILEIGFNALSLQTLDLALERASRGLRTGTFQESADGTAAGARLKRAVCNGTFVLFSCDDLRVEVASAAPPSLPQPSDPYDPQTKDWASSFGTRFECPKGADVVIVRAAAPVPRLLWFLDITGRILPDGRQMLVTTRVFQSESYSQKACA
jgi:hypothetical protein